MKRKFKMAMTLTTLVSLGVTGLASCGNSNETNSGKDIELTKSYKDSDTLYTNVTYSLEAKYKLDENAKFTFTSNAASAFKSSSDGNRLDFSFSAAGLFKITAALESDATIFSTIDVNIVKGEESYVLSVDTSNMVTTTFEQGSQFNSEGLVVRKAHSVNGVLTEGGITLGKDQYTLTLIDESGAESSLVDGTVLKVAGDFEVIVKAKDQKISDGSFEITVASRPTYLADQFFDKMDNNYSVMLVSESETEANKYTYIPWIVRNERYILSYDSILMGTAGIGFYKDEANDVVRQFYLDLENSTEKENKFIAGRPLSVDYGLSDEGKIVRTQINDLNYTKGFFKYKDGQDYDRDTFSKEGKASLVGGNTVFQFNYSSETTSFLAGILGLTELLNYGFTITPQISFIESDGLNLIAMLSIIIQNSSGLRTGGNFIITNDAGIDEDVEKFLSSNPTPNLKTENALQKSIDVIRTNNFMASDESNFVDGFNDTETTKDSSFGVYYATPDSYLYSSGIRDSETQAEQYMKKGVIKIGEGTVKEPGYYGYTSKTKDGSDATLSVPESSPEAVFNQYMPSNWPGFSTAEDKFALAPGYNFSEEWLLQTLPTNSYAEYDENGYPIGDPIGYEYQFRLAGSLSALMWSVVTCLEPAYAELFAGDSLIINASTDLEGKLTGLSIVFHGAVSEKYQSQMKTYSACNILGITIDLDSVGKTVNPHYQKLLESLTPTENDQK